MPIRFPNPSEKDDPVGVLLPYFDPKNSLSTRAKDVANVNRILMWGYVATFILFLLFVMFVSW